MTYVYGKALSPSLLLPWKLVLLFTIEEKFVLDVEELIQSREEPMNDILAKCASIYESTFDSRDRGK